MGARAAKMGRRSRCSFGKEIFEALQELCICEILGKDRAR